MAMLCKYHGVLCKRLDCPWILVSSGILKPISCGHQVLSLDMDMVIDIRRDKDRKYDAGAIGEPQRACEVCVQFLLLES